MKKLDNYGYLFILPFFIIFITFTIYPIILTFYYSLTSYTGMGSPEFIGLANYQRLITDSYFLQAFINTLYIWGINFSFQLSIALLLAVLFSDLRLKMKGLSFFRAIFYLPNLITIASVALLFGILLGWHHGTINHLLLDLGIISQPINWLNSPTTARWSVALIGAWMWFGHTFIILMAGIAGISNDYYEAAIIDGANCFQTFINVTIPLLKPILLYVLITSLIGGLQIFDLPMLITDGMGSPQGSLNTMVLYLYNQAFRFNNYGYAAAVAYGLFLITVLFSIVIFKVMYRNSVKEG